MSNENEMLARWLGFAMSAFGGWKHPNGGIYQPIDFRASNEWAGALLEKLHRNGFSLISESDNRSWYWGTSAAEGHAGTWRDAVVDAALEVIRQESRRRDGAK